VKSEADFFREVPVKGNLVSDRREKRKNHQFVESAKEIIERKKKISKRGKGKRGLPLSEGLRLPYDVSPTSTARDYL